MTKIPTQLLSSGQHIPQIGFGLWQVKNPADIELSVTEAVKNGYRHFDSAQIYGNEAQLAEALLKTDLKR